MNKKFDKAESIWKGEGTLSYEWGPIIPVFWVQADLKLWGGPKIL